MSLSCIKECETIGIIGTAGRRKDFYRLSEDVYILMLKEVLRIIGDRNVHLISGGAAWSDHLAVTTFINSLANPSIPKCTLSLELPCVFINGTFDRSETGRISNYYHKLFSFKSCRDSLSEIQKVINLGPPDVYVNYGKGFFERNAVIANKSDKLIAFTYGDKEKLKDGGTAHTAKAYIDNGGKHLFHINLYDFKCYELDYFPE